MLILSMALASVFEVCPHSIACSANKQVKSIFVFHSQSLLVNPHLEILYFYYKMFLPAIMSYLMTKISIITDISVVQFYGYIGYIGRYFDTKYRLI